MKLVQTMSLENPCPTPKSTNRIKRSSVCCVHFCMSNFINCQWKLELSWDLLMRLSSQDTFSPVKPSVSLVVTFTVSVILTTTCSFGPDPQILRVASSWGKAIFHTSVLWNTSTSHWKSQSGSEATTCWNFRADWEVTGKLALHWPVFSITNLKVHSPEKGGLSVHTRMFLKEEGWY